MGGLELFGLNMEQAVNLPRGKRKSVAGYLLHYGYYQEACDLLRRIVSEDPNGMLYRMWLVQALTGNGQLDEAYLLSNKLLSDFPEHAGVISARAGVLMALGSDKDAFDMFGRYMTDPTHNFSYWTQAGIAAQRNSEWEKSREALDNAFRIYRETITENPENYTTPIYLWNAIVKQGEHDGTDIGGFRTELDNVRKQEEDKIREVLAAPDRKTKRPLPPVQPAVDRPDAAPALEDCAANPDLESHLSEYFGFDEFRPGQQQIIEHILKGQSVLAVLPTGGGKSLCYQLPAMMLDGVTLVVSPLIALMKDQVDGLPADVQKQVTLVNSSLDGDEIDRRLRDISVGKYKLVYAAPERLRQKPFLHTLRKRGVSLLVVDEAHCVSMWGHDFRPDYLFIGDALRYLGDPTVLAMTATATPQMRQEISNHLGRRMEIISTGSYRPNLFLESIMVKTDEDKMREVVRICREIDGSGIVYTRSRKKAEELARILKREHIKATYYHAGMNSEERSRTQEEFMDDRWRVICATVAFGMGIDKPDVRFVIHNSPPSSLEDYYQEAGRAGRDGEMSRCVLLCTPSDKASITRWMRQEMMDSDLPRKCYKYLRELTPNQRFAAVSIDDFKRETEQDETRIRVAISMLEDIDLAKRHPDVPTTFTISLTPLGAQQSDEEFMQFMEHARLRVSQKISYETLDLYRRTNILPSEIEDKLLEWSNDGWINYYGSGRVMLLERLSAPRDTKQRLENLLSKYAEAQEKRIATAFYYAETRHCKHDTIAAHFGEPTIEGCVSCDNCAPQRQPGWRKSKRTAPAASSLSDEQRRRKVLETVAMIPAQVGFTGLVKVLKGSIASHIKHERCKNFGVLANVPKTTIERCVGELIESGHLDRDDGEYRLISLGKKGAEELKRN